MPKIIDQYVKADKIAAMKEEERWFKVLAEGDYEEFNEKMKLVIPVELSNGDKTLYIPNKTSEIEMVKLAGDHTKNWVNKSFNWEVAKQNVKGELRNALFVTSIRT